ncbi:MAG: polysaccharide biosynthesis/export family protein [Planctomycetota bacterium]
MSRSTTTGLRRAFGLAELEREVREELAAHIDELRDAYLAEGNTPGRARALALDRFGDVESHVIACLEERWKKEQPMRNTVILLALLLSGALGLSYVQARKARAEAGAAAALVAETIAGLKPREATFTPLQPSPVIFGIGDELIVSDALGRLSARVRVAADGKVLLPELGWVEAFGKERAAFEAELTERYLEYFEDARMLVAPASALVE